MDSYEKRSDAYDRFFDKGMDKLDRYEEKLDNDMHPDKKIKLYKELIDQAHSFYMECLAKEQRIANYTIIPMTHIHSTSITRKNTKIL